MALLPIMFKLGVISTLLVFLVGIGLKGIAIGMTILVLNLSFVFGKIISYFGGFKHHHHKHGHPGLPGLSSLPGWEDKDIHVHLHHSHPPPPPPPTYGSWQAPVPVYDPVSRVSDPTLDPYRQYTFYEKLPSKMPWQQ
jgi:hypothetical protein